MSQNQMDLPCDRLKELAEKFLQSLVLGTCEIAFCKHILARDDILNSKSTFY